jgi:hypothetical protein
LRLKQHPLKWAAHELLSSIVATPRCATVSACRSSHNRAADNVLGLQEVQLNKLHTYANTTEITGQEFEEVNATKQKFTTEIAKTQEMGAL